MRQGADERAHPLAKAPEQRRTRLVGPDGHLSAQSPHQAATALGGRQEGRVRRCGGHVVDRARVDTSEERIDQGVDYLPAQLAGHERPHRTVSHRPSDIGSREQRVAGQAQHACRTQGTRAHGRPEPGGNPSACPSGSGRSRLRAHTDAPCAAMGSKAATKPSSWHSSTASGRRPRNPSGPMSTRRPPNISLRRGPPRRGDASISVTRCFSAPPRRHRSTPTSRRAR